MGRVIDLNSPLSPEDKQYLIARSRGHLIAANERRFGPNGDQIREGDVVGQPQQSEFYDNEERENAHYDIGGAPLPGTVLHKDTGRVMDRENGVLYDYTGPGHTNSATDIRHNANGFAEHGEEDDVDDDIVHAVLSIRTMKELREKLSEAGVEIPTGSKREDLENLLAIHLQDERDAGRGQGDLTESE